MVSSVSGTIDAAEVVSTVARTDPLGRPRPGLGLTPFLVVLALLFRLVVAEVEVGGELGD